MKKKEIGESLRAAPRGSSNCFKLDREEELSFFRDLQKREKDQAASLLQPVSEEFEANGSAGNYGLYRMESGGRKGPGLEFLAESGKNDYNWLKTPPATPLFPSLEMEANGQELVMQREIPIIHPISRFAGNPEGKKTSINTSTLHNPNPKHPQRHKTPTGRPSVLPPSVDKKNMKTPPSVITDQKMNHTARGAPDKTKSNLTPIAKSTTHRQTKPTATFLASNIPKSMGKEPNASKSTRGVSPFARPTTPGCSIADEAPPNLRTSTINRPASATRGRPMNQNLSIPQKQESSSKTIRRQSCSPSVTRGRKVGKDGNAATQTNSSTSGKVTNQAGNRGQVLGSRMVDRFMNARISNAEDRQTKTKQNGFKIENLRITKDEEAPTKVKLYGSMNESSGFGRLLSKSSLDMAVKHKVIK